VREVIGSIFVESACIYLGGMFLLMIMFLWIDVYGSVCVMCLVVFCGSVYVYFSGIYFC